MLTRSESMLVLLILATPLALLCLPRVLAAVQRIRSGAGVRLVDHVREAVADEEMDATALLSHIEDLIRRTSPPARELAEVALLLDWEDRLPEALVLAEKALALSPSGEDVVGAAAMILHRAGETERALKLIAHSAAIRGLTREEYGVLRSLGAR